MSMPTREKSQEGFAQFVREYCQQDPGRPVAILQAGCPAALRELGIDELRARGLEISVTAVDDDNQAARTALEHASGLLDDTIVGDLRTVPLPPRGFDIAHCTLLIDRVAHVELVLDRLVTALRPGGLLLLRTFDRESAAGLLDRMAPTPLRRAIWRRFYPEVPGPCRAVYEPVVSKSGIAGYAQRRGLVIAHRSVAATTAGQQDKTAAIVQLSRAAISWLTRGSRSSAHDQLVFVIRKPEDRFARVVLHRQHRRYRHGGISDRRALARGAGNMALLDTKRGAARRA